MESNMELDDDMLLVIVGDEDYLDVIRPLQEVTQKEDSISDGISLVETLDNEGLLVPAREDPVSKLRVIKKQHKAFKHPIKKKPDDFSQVEHPDESFVNFLKCKETFGEAPQPVLRRGRGRPRKSTQDFASRRTSGRRRPKPNPKYNMYMRELAKKTIKEDKKKLLEDLLNFDDFDVPLSWFKNTIEKANLRKTTEKDKSFEDADVSSDDSIRTRRKVRSKRKGLKRKCTKKDKSPEDSAVVSNNNITPSSESQKARSKANPKVKHENLKRKSIKKEKQFEDLAASSDEDIQKENKQIEDSAVISDEDIQKENKQFENSAVTSDEDIQKEYKLFEDSAASSDEEYTPSLKFPNTRRRAFAAAKCNISAVAKKILKKEENEIFEDTAIDSDDNMDIFFQFRDLRRGFNPNPKSYVAELIKQHPQFADDTEALVDELAKIMKQVKPPPLPQDYFIMNNISFECIKCDHLSETMPAASRHYCEKHGPRYLICYACGVNFRSKTNLYKHEKRCIAPDADIVLRARARMLGAKGRGRPFLDTTPKVPTKPAKREFPCTLCPAKFLTPAWLAAHTNSHMGLRPYVCDLCGRSYTSRVTLWKHKKKHTNQQYICDHCQRPFKVKAALVVHLNTHLPQNRFLCAECPQRYAHRAALDRHTARRHRGLAPPAACALCPNRYSRTWHLKNHMLRVHGVHIMTRKHILYGKVTNPTVLQTFYRRLPTMTEKQLKEATVVVKADLENMGAGKEVSNRDGLLNASATDESKNVKMKVEKSPDEDMMDRNSS